MMYGLQGGLPSGSIGPGLEHALLLGLDSSGRLVGLPYTGLGEPRRPPPPKKVFSLSPFLRLATGLGDIGFDKLPRFDWGKTRSPV